MGFMTLQLLRVEAPIIRKDVCISEKKQCHGSG